MSPLAIHDFDRSVDRLHQRIAAADIAVENKEILRQFDQYCITEGLSSSRRLKLLEHGFVLSTRYLRVPFRAATADDIRAAVCAIEISPLAPWTKHDFKVAIRKLFKFVAWGHDGLRRKDYPPSVASISIRIKKRDQVRIQAADILTEEEVRRLIAVTHSTQERAIVSLMYELGARVGEIAALRVGNVTRDQFSFVCDVNGKTGPRSVRAVLASGALTAWLNVHPHGSDPTAALWGEFSKKQWQQRPYSGFQRLLRRAQAGAGIRKRVHPHLLRHSRITHVLASGQMNEAQAKVYFGLVADSKMFSTYSHLLASDANNAVLRMYGIGQEEPGVLLAPQRCGMCTESNTIGSLFCAKCGYALSQKAPVEAQAALDESSALLEEFLRLPRIRSAFQELVRRKIERERALPPRAAAREVPIRGAERSAA